MCESCDYCYGTPAGNYYCTHADNYACLVYPGLERPVTCPMPDFPLFFEMIDYFKFSAAMKTFI